MAPTHPIPPLSPIAGTAPGQGVMGERQGVWVGAIPRGCPAGLVPTGFVVREHCRGRTGAEADAVNCVATAGMAIYLL
ncbi:MAG TPA: hypothetical protein VFB60_21955 [Ktedonobacteraceae bacterium]|nr:hypothetical protein [Ktedonobacteraceae bacterium]